MSVNDASRIVIYHQKSLKSEKCHSARGHSGPSIAKLFTTVIYTNVSNKQVFVSGKHFQLSLIFTSTAGSYLSEPYLRYPTLG